MTQYIEDKIHIACKHWFDTTYPDLALLLHHSPNEGYIADKRQCAKRKAMGVRNGFPDFILCLPRHNFGAMAIEVKTYKGAQSDSQKEWERVFTQYGGTYHIIRSKEDFIKTINWYLNN